MVKSDFVPKPEVIAVNDDYDSQIRFSAKGFKSMRTRLGLSAEAISILLGVTGQTIYSWEAEKSRPRKSQLAKIVALRSMGKKQIDQLLSQL